MNLKVKAFLVALLLVAVGFIAGIFASGFVKSVFAPSNHKAIIDRITVMDTAANFYLQPELVYSNNIEWAKGLSDVPFVKGNIYQETVWVWKRYTDTEIVMSIIGPDESGTMYLIEVGRLGAHPFEVKVDGVTQLTIEWAQTTPSVGYYWFTVVAS